MLVGNKSLRHKFLRLKSDELLQNFLNFRCRTFLLRLLFSRGRVFILSGLLGRRSCWRWASYSSFLIFPVVQLHQLIQVNLRPLQNLHLHNTPEKKYWKKLVLTLINLSDLNIVERVNSLSDLYNETGEGILKELFNELLQTAGRNLGCPFSCGFLAPVKWNKFRKSGNKQLERLFWIKNIIARKN